MSRSAPEQVSPEERGMHVHESVGRDSDDRRDGQAMIA